MGNKEGKTFADLFSSSTEENETTTQTFSDILNNNAEKKEKSSSNEITFDSIFEKLPPNETIEESTKEKDKFNIFDQNAKDEKIINIKTATQELEQLKDSTVEKTKDLPNPFFSMEATNILQNSNENEKEEQKENLIKEAIFNQEKSNPFFEEIDTKKAINTEKASSIDNFFFQAPVENNLEDKENLNIKPNVDITPQNIAKEPLKDNNSVEEYINPKDNNVEVQNPFFQNESSTSIIEERNLSTESNLKNNPFFEESNLKIEESKIEPLHENKIESTLLTGNTSQQNKLEKSTSPFFQEEPQNEENPFFQNQINLIENEMPNTPSSNIDTTKSKHYNVKVVKKKEPLIKFILGVLSYAMFIWLLLIGITLLIYVLDIKIRAAKGDYSSPTFNAYVVLTGSMLPEIEVYDVVITKKVEAEKLVEGDVITFASADSRFLGTIITHRIIKKNPKTDTEGYTFQTQGDNNNVADSALVPEKNIYGKVILKIPKLGYLQEFLASDGGWIIVILIPCLTVISYDIVKLAKGLKRKKYKNIKIQK